MAKKNKKKTNHPVEFLPSIKRTNDIIRGIKAMQVMKHIKAGNVSLLENLLKDFKNNLNTYLSRISNKIRDIDTDIHCRDLNYILDTILERIFEIKGIEHIRLQHYIQEPSLRLLNNQFTYLKCPRNIFDSNNNFMHIKKHMYDLCEDIGYIINEQTEIHKKSDCKDIISRVSERQEKLRKVYHSNPQHHAFKIDSNCTIDYIMKKFTGKECDAVAKPSRAMERTGSILKDQSEEGREARPALPTVPGPGLEDEVDQEDDVDLSDAVVTDFGMNMPLQLPPGEEPKLDTTYAAASLCGVSLIGAMIYKFKPFGFGSRAPGMRNGMGGYPLPHAANGDYFMDNFEYLQTSIPNNEYHLGYGPAADH